MQSISDQAKTEREQEKFSIEINTTWYIFCRYKNNPKSNIIVNTIYCICK